MFQTVDSWLPQLRSGGSAWTLRLVDERAESLSVRRDVPQPTQLSRDRGAMVTVYAAGGAGYAATSDVSRDGVQRALDRAERWARATAARSVVDFTEVPVPALAVTLSEGMTKR